MDVNANFLRAEFVDNIKVHPKDIHNNMSSVILKQLKNTKEGICSNHGYIKKDTIELVKLSCGKVEMSSFHGYLNFLVKYSALVCNPVKGNIVNAIVVNINNFGILCSSFIEDDSGKVPILEIIVPKHSLAIQSDVDLQNNVKINDDVSIQIIGKKYQLFNKKISIIGKIVKKALIDVKLDNSDSSINVYDLDDDDNLLIDDDDLDEDEDEDDEKNEDDNNENDENDENNGINENNNDNNDNNDNNENNNEDDDDDADLEDDLSDDISDSDEDED
jgi:DNA-directed RNA polymerase subunit E'/Rpb7